jgi:hypothetical protein
MACDVYIESALVELDKSPRLAPFLHSGMMRKLISGLRTRHALASGAGLALLILLIRGSGLLRESGELRPIARGPVFLNNLTSTHVQGSEQVGGSVSFLVVSTLLGRVKVDQ